VIQLLKEEIETAKSIPTLVEEKISLAAKSPELPPQRKAKRPTQTALQTFKSTIIRDEKMHSSRTSLSSSIHKQN